MSALARRSRRTAPTEASETARRGPPKQTGPWYGRDKDCLRFDLSARRFPGLKISKGGGRSYHVPIEVPFYNETRQVEIRFKNWSREPRIYADGPDESPHRYPQDGSLCIWYPWDPPEQRWVFDDGLLMLINLIQGHLFREAWWRDTGEWPGPEATHGPPKEEVKEDSAEREQPDLPRSDQSRRRL